MKNSDLFEIAAVMSDRVKLAQRMSRLEDIIDDEECGHLLGYALQGLSDARGYLDTIFERECERRGWFSSGAFLEAQATDGKEQTDHRAPRKDEREIPDANQKVSRSGSVVAVASKVPGK